MKQVIFLATATDLQAWERAAERSRLSVGLWLRSAVGRWLDGDRFRTVLADASGPFDVRVTLYLGNADRRDLERCAMAIDESLSQLIRRIGNTEARA